MSDLTTVKRLNYFDHQFLRANDFTDEQGYHVTLRRLHNQLLHSWGIADGLDVSFEGGATSVTVASGVAMDSLGREIVLPADQAVELASYPADRDIFLTVTYDEQATDETVETGAAGKTRMTEQPRFAPLQNAPGDPGQQIVLAIVKRTGTEVTGLDKTGRRVAGAAGGSLDVLGLGFRDPNIVSTGWVRMRLEAANRAMLQGTLHVTAGIAADGDVTIGGQLTVTGPVAAQGGGAVTGNFSVSGQLAVGAANPNAPLDVRGAARVGTLAFTDGNGNPFADGSIGMANNLDGSTKWLQIGGITDAGQRRIGLNASRVLVTGALGIGVAQPAQALHVAGNAQVNNVFLGDVGHGATWAGFSHASARSTTSYALLQSSDGLNTFVNKKSGGGSIAFRIDNVDRLTMLDTGNLGIGTTTPAANARLHVVGGAIMPAVGNAENAGIQFPPDPGGGGGDRAWLRYYAETGETTRLVLGIGNDADDRLGLYQAGTERLTIYNGNVGINQQTPAYMLHVQGNGFFAGNLGTTGILYTGAFPSTTQRNPTFTTGEVQVTGSNGGGFAFGNRETPDANLWDNVAGNRWVLYSTQSIARLWTAQYGDVMWIDSVGNMTTRGWLRANGGKFGYVADLFINGVGDALEEGDVVVISDTQATMRIGEDDRIPVPEVDLASKAADTRVCGIVAQSHGEAQATSKRKNAPKELREFTVDEREEIDMSRVEPGQIGTMATLGAFGTCKVDASYGAIKVGDLLTTSETPGHAMKVAEPAQAVGAIVGKALAPLARGKGKIPVMVLLH